MEELINKHLHTLNVASGFSNHQAYCHTQLTIDYMGRFAEWIENKYFFSELDKLWYGHNKYSGRESYTSPQLIDLYFKTNK